MQHIKSFIENNEKAEERKNNLFDRLLNLSGDDPLREELLIQRLEELEQREELILNLIYDSNVLTDRQALVVTLRMEGKKLREIGEFISVGRERVRQMLRDCYRLIADEL